MLRDRVEHQVLAMTTAAHLARAMGSDVEIPDMDEAMNALDALLVATPRAVAADPEKQALMEALNLR